MNRQCGMQMRVVLAASLAVSIFAGCDRSSGDEAESAASYASASELESFCDRLPRPGFARLEKHASSTDWFEVYEIEADVWAIHEPYQWQEVISYLIIGSDAAVLFDTGNGIGDIKSIVDQLTEKPIRVINSHSHFDHVGGNYQFETVLSVATPFTLRRTDGMQSEELSMEVSDEATCKRPPDGVTPDTHRIRPFSIRHTIEDGEIIDIGGRSLEVLRVPGHTDDAIALLDRQSGFLWSGDSFYEGPIWLFFPETDLVAYKASVERFAALVPDLKAVFPAHNTPQADPALLISLRDNVNDVLAGNVEATPVGDGNVEFRFEGFSLLMRENYHRIDLD